VSFYFGTKSLEKLYECHPWLVELMLYSIRTSEDDITIICGYRSNEDQQKAYDSKHSKLKAGQSKHNNNPSLAIDIAPYPISWDNIDLFDKIGNHIKDCADFLGISIVWGGDWRSFKDYGHFELKGDN
jgi:peptidoglycan L-alanyl-D-glutamate endopeptidase CwlK